MDFSPIPFDYHSHHRRCGHAAGEIADYIESAIDLGLTEFGVSDHNPCYWQEGDHPIPGTYMARSELSTYVTEASEMKERYADRIAVQVGIEADFMEGQEGELADLLEAHPFDYALGSVHWVGGMSIFYRDRWQNEDGAATYAEYYRLLAQAARSGLFDIMSHLTAVEAYGPPITDAVTDALYPPVVEAIAESGCIVEVNTSGYRKTGVVPFPNPRLLSLLVRAGVPLTFGSDCHKPAEVSYARAEVQALLADLDVDTRQSQPVTVRRGPIQAFVTNRTTQE